MENRRLQIKIVGESGAGLLSTGEILIESLIDVGLYVFADREFPSLIKGGHSCFNIVVSDKPISSISSVSDVMVALDKPSLKYYENSLKDGGLLVHGYDRVGGIADLLAGMMKREVRVVGVESRKLSRSVGGNVLMKNVCLLGVLWKVFGLDVEYVSTEVKNEFGSKPKLLELDLKVLQVGYESVDFESSESDFFEQCEFSSKTDLNLLNGNRSIALGAVDAELDCYYAYPMSPSSSILSYMANFKANGEDIVVKQAEDEITAVQLAIGSMFVGARAMTATSGGGFDLMTESVSLAGMIENPLVIVNVQRPGPATGLPTWTAQADLDLVVNAGHGEFGRMVISVGGADDAYYLIAEAFNFAEKFQIPVVVLSDKHIADSLMLVDTFEKGRISIERGLVNSDADIVSEMRYALTDSGVSPRWLPCSNEANYFANGDEHFVDGTLTEEADESGLMAEKRMRKMDSLLESIPDAEYFGSIDCETVFVGWGSTKLVMKDIVERFKGKVGYIHYSYLYPLRTDLLREFLESKKLILIEGNYKGQLGNMLERELGTGVFDQKILKYNGRQFMFDDLVNLINEEL